jgi:hypothetical protein
MRDHRSDHCLTATEREFVLDQLLTDLWKAS